MMPDALSTARRAERSGARWAVCLLLICLALDGAALASALSHRAVLARLASSEMLLPRHVAAGDAPPGAIDTVQLMAYACTGIVWLVWLRRAYGNLALVGTKRTRFTPGWAVGYWLIPFVNLVRPYQIMKELWLRSESRNDRDAYDQLPAATVVSVWWGAYVSYGLLGRIIDPVARGAQSLDALTTATDVGLLVRAVGIVAAVLAIKVVREIDQHQQRFDSSPAGVLRP